MKTHNNIISEEERQVENPVNTICEKIRYCYNRIKEYGLDDVLIKLRQATYDAKRMDKKLREYKADWDKDMWEKKE